MKYLLGLLLLATQALAGDDLRLTNLFVDYRNYHLLNDKARNVLTYPEPPKEGIDVNIQTRVLSHFFWDSKIMALTTDAQYRSIGLNMRAGVSLTQTLDVFYEHQSLHVIDRPINTMPKFPVEDSIGVRIYLYREKANPDSLF